MVSVPAGRHTKRVVRLGQLAGAHGRARCRETCWPVVPGDSESQRATPIDGLERPKLLGLRPEHRDRSLRADLHRGAREAHPGRRWISIDAGEGGIEALRSAADALHRAVQSLQTLAGGGEFLIGTRALGLECGESLVLVERLR